MSTPNAQAGAISFAHLAGITTPVHAAKADAPDDDKKDAKKAEDDSDDESMESDEPKKDEAKKAEDDSDEEKAEDDKPDDADEDDKKSKKARSASGISKGIAQERARWTAVVASKSFAKHAAMGAHMLANTSMSADAILSVLRDAPAAASQSDAARSARNPSLGAGAPAFSPTTNDRWGAAFKRAGIA